MDLIAEILTGRLPTSFDVNAAADERAETADRLTQEQATILGVTRLLTRVEVRGGAGSGKTVLALQQAKQLSNGRDELVGTFHDFGRQWGAPDGDRTDSDFWERRLPALMTELADGLPDGRKHDAIIVDEARDFADDWWQPVLTALRDEDRGGLCVYSDEYQRIFARFGRPPVQLAPLALDHNLRNTQQIHEAFGPLAPSRMYSRGAVDALLPRETEGCE
ncbi:DUF2075 domain-containing protein [Aeromicrobium duanguangcaii]|uniref:DUF2075 domain-containing protein n=1 Tax=Aeromicrobium duanguangcaii TaxID=2968086 RepID=A0ABY5KIB7_9ACTN|nr:DUF2075 domain-containing protein [Aeromicrobium duanguangcaii]MCD9153373.1 DUF2075 domain-containing protein [Aeromicrobium duanguangcaii]UUI69534.1 DUF2075 domain-containing protein [Aeromicrobium duanguangcaii]